MVNAKKPSKQTKPSIRSKIVAGLLLFFALTLAFCVSAPYRIAGEYMLVGSPRALESSEGRIITTEADCLMSSPRTPPTPTAGYPFVVTEIDYDYCKKFGYDAYRIEGVAGNMFVAAVLSLSIVPVLYRALRARAYKK